MAQVNPYLMFDGNCDEAFKFYKSAFGGDFSYIGKFKDMPPAEGCEAVSQEDGEKIMHVSLPISKETILMGSDILEAYGQKHSLGDNYSVSINTDSQEEADKLFNSLSAGGKVTMPMEKTFWGAYFGMFADKFGIHWMVNFDEVKE